MTSPQLKLVQDSNDFELQALEPLVPFVTKRAVTDGNGKLLPTSVVVFTQAPSPWPFCPNVKQLTLPFWREILSGSTIEALAQADRTEISLRPPVVQGIARQESLYATNASGSANRTRGKRAIFFSKSSLEWPLNPKYLEKLLSEKIKSEAECVETRSEPSACKTTQ